MERPSVPASIPSRCRLIGLIDPGWFPEPSGTFIFEAWRSQSLRFPGRATLEFLFCSHSIGIFRPMDHKVAKPLPQPAWEGSTAPHPEARRGRGAVTNAVGRYEPEARENSSTTAGTISRPRPHRCAPPCRWTPPAPSLPATRRRTSASTAPSIPIAAASMAVPTASRGRRMPISACRRGSTSRPACSPSPTPPCC